MSLINKFDWVIAAWVCQTVFFAAGIAFYVKALSSGLHAPTIQLYLLLSIAFLVVLTVTAIFTNGSLRDGITAAVLLANTFIIPFSFDSYGLALNYVALAAMTYAIAAIALSPKHVAAAILVASIAFSCYLHYDRAVFRKFPLFDKQLAELERKLISDGESPIKDGTASFFTVKRIMTLKTASSLKDVYGDPSKWELLYKANKSRVESPDAQMEPGTVLIVPSLPKVPIYDFLLISLAYIAGAAIAFCWRILIAKMYELYAMAMSNSSKHAQKQVDELKSQLEAGKSDLRLLKEEMALHMIEMNRMSSSVKK